MRTELLRLVALLLVLASAACADHPTSPWAVPVADPLSDCYWREDGTAVCPPISSASECDPWESLNWCEDDGGECLTSAPGHPGDAAPQGCPGGGGGGGGGGGTRPPPQCPDWDPDCGDTEPEPDTCVTNDPVINDPVVEAAFADLWANSNPDAPQSERVEQAAWVVQTQYGLDVIPWTDADFGPCTIAPHIGRFSIPTNAIAWIHTHPFTEGEVQTSCEPIGYDANGQPIHGTYNKFPNEDDIELAGLINQSLGRNIDAYTIDEGNIVRFLATSTTTVSTYEPYGRCGY